MEAGKKQWMLIAGLMFVGMGVGSLFDQIGIGTMLGLGLGLLAYFYLQKKWLGFQTKHNKPRNYHSHFNSSSNSSLI